MVKVVLSSMVVIQVIFVLIFVASVDSRQFFYNTSTGVCQFIDAYSLTSLNLFSSVEECIVASDLLGPGDRMFLDWKSEFNCPKPELMSTSVSSLFEVSSRDMIGAMVAGDVARIAQRTNSISMVDWQKDANGWTMLHHAANSGNVIVVAQLVEMFGANLASTTRDLETPLHLATRRQHYKTVQVLIDLAIKKQPAFNKTYAPGGRYFSETILSAMVNAREKCGFTALHYAAAVGNVEIAGLLRRHGADPLTRSATGKLPLHVARFYDIVDYLLPDIDDMQSTVRIVNTPDNFGRPPFFYAGFKPDDEGGKLMVAARLIDLGANYISHRDNYGMTALHFAVAKNNVNFTTFLANKMTSQEINDATCCGFARTVTHVAARFNAIDALNALVSRERVRLDLTRTDLLGQDAFCVALSSENPDVVQLLRRNGVMPGKSCFDAFIGAVNDVSPTPLHDAVTNQQIDVVSFLLGKGASVDVTEPQHGRNPLQQAILQCHSAVGAEMVAKVLLSVSKTALESEDKNGETALELAVRYNCQELITTMLLSKYNADCQKLNRDGLTALHVAKKLGFNQLVGAMVATGKCSLGQMDSCGTTVEKFNSSRISSCGQIPSVLNGKVIAESNCVLAKAKLVCESNYKLRGVEFIECGLDGKWSTSGFCQDARYCSDMPVIANGRITNTGNLISPPGSLRYIDCNDGYYCDGSRAVRCGESGNWVLDGRCVRGCKEVPSVVNGSIAEGESGVGAVRDLVCYSGYMVNGSIDVICSEEGKWIVNGYCIVEQCLNDPYIENGRVTNGSSLLGALRLASCDKGYGLTASRIVVCGTTYTWQIPLCKKVKYMDELLEAAKDGDVRRMEQALQEGADVDGQRPNDGWTALIRAANHGHMSAVRLLIDRGADVNLSAKDGSNALFWAAYYGYLDLMRLLIDYDVNVNARTQDGDSPLLQAARNDRREAVRILVESGADVNAKDVDGYTALIYAVCYGRTDECLFLIEHGADVNAATNEGKTSLDYAHANYFEAIAQYLTAHGARNSSPLPTAAPPP